MIELQGCSSADTGSQCNQGVRPSSDKDLHGQHQCFQLLSWLSHGIVEVSGKCKVLIFLRV